MKTLILAGLGAGTLVGALLWLNKPQTPRASPFEPEAESAPVPAGEAQPRPDAERASIAQPLRSPPQPVRTFSSTEPVATAAQDSLDKTMVDQSVDMLVSAQTPYSEKQAVWKQLIDSGRLDAAIGELERRMAADPRVAEYPAALGQAYLRKCSILHDVREQGILGMQADKLFDAALSLDPANWEARFTKAVALSYWPASLNKGQEVLQLFQTLIDQQEAQTPQPHFAQSYVWMGDEYAKLGRPDYARTLWERGQGLFPSDEALKQRLSAPASAPDSNPASGQPGSSQAAP